MSNNLIPAADLPVTESKEVDVLCVENGELKRKSGANLGGAGSYIIRVNPEEVSISDSSGLTITLTESRDNFGPILEAGGVVWLDLSRTVLSSLLGVEKIWVMASTWSFVSNMLVLSTTAGNMSGNAIAMNGTWTPSEG